MAAAAAEAAADEEGDDGEGEKEEAAAAAAGTAGVECPSARPRLSFISRSRASGCIAADAGACSAADIQAALGAMPVVLGVDAGVAIWLTAHRNTLPAGGRTTEEWGC